MACKLYPRVRARGGYSLTGTYQAASHTSLAYTQYDPRQKTLAVGLNEYIEDEVLIDPSASGNPFCTNDRFNTTDGGNLNNKSVSKVGIVFKEVYHSKSSVDIPFHDASFVGVDPPVEPETFRQVEATMDSYYWWADKLGPRWFVPELSSGQTGVTNQELWSAVLRLEPSFESYLEGVNLWGIILELNQLKNLLGVFVINADSLRKEGLAEKHLQYSFGVAPMMGDLGKIWGIISRLDSIIDKWNDLADNRQLLNFHEFIKTTNEEKLSQPIDTIASTITGAGRTTGSYDLLEESVSKVHVYGYANRIPDSMRFKVFIRALGLDKPITGLWEAVPFSWAVDYFVNVGDMISTWETGLDSMFRLDVISAGFSEKVKFSLRVRVTESYDPTRTTRSGTIISTSGEEAGTVYKRFRLPTNTLFSDAKLHVTNDMRVGMFLGYKQASYLGALAILYRK